MSGTRQSVGILGAGRWGLTLAQVAAQHGQSTYLWSEDSRRAGRLQSQRKLKSLLPELDELHAGVTATSDLALVASQCHTLVIACGAGETRAIARQVGAVVDGSHVVLHAVRGLEPGTLRRATRVIREETCARKVGALAGPALVEELLAGRPNAFVCASRYPEVIRRARQAFAGDAVRVYASKDLAGVELAAAASAVAAVGVGIALQLGLGSATLATFVTRSAAEMARVVEAAGGQAASAMGLAGLGELLALRESGSREVEAGRMLAAGKTPAQITKKLGHLDAVDAAKTFKALAEHYGVETHIGAVVADLLAGEVDAPTAIRSLMTLSHMAE